MQIFVSGAVGEKGDKGDPGAQGPQGIQGIQGEQGLPGADNATQIQGVPVDLVSPKEGEVLYFNGEKWTPKDGREESNLNFNTFINGGYF